MASMIALKALVKLILHMLIVELKVMILLTVIVFGVKKDPAHIGNITKKLYNSVNDSDDNNKRRKDKSVNANEIDSGNVVIVFGVEKDPTNIGNITKNIDNSINDANDNNINSRRKDKSAIGVIDHAVSDVMQPNCVEMNVNDTASNDNDKCN